MEKKEKRAKRLQKYQHEKKAIESAVALLNSQIQGIQQQLVNHNRDFLILQGKIELLEEMEKEETDKDASS